MEEKSEKKKRASRGSSALSPIVFLVMMAFALSTGILGYQLGHGASSTGELLDTIVLSSGEGSGGSTGGQTNAIVHFLSGRVRYGDGSPCENMLVRLGEKRECTTDSSGKFYFSDVRSGSAVLEVIKEGRVIAGTEISLDFSAEGIVNAEILAEGPSFTLPEDTRMLEVTVEMEEESGSLKVDTGSSYLITAGGSVVDFSGGMLSSQDHSYSVTPSGNVVVPEGYVLVLPQETVITPRGEETEQRDSEIISGLLVHSGTAETVSGAVIREDGTIAPAEGAPVGGNGQIVTVDDSNPEKAPEELDALPEEYAPPEPEASFQPSPSLSPAPTEPPLVPANGGSTPTQPLAPSPTPEPTQSPTPEPSSSPTPEPTPEPTPQQGGLKIEDGDTGISWAQQSTVNLFGKITESGVHQANRNEESLPVIAPGSSGYYDFVLENQEDYDIDFDVTVVEQSFHLPILYSIQDVKTKRYYLHNSKMGAETQEEGAIAMSVVRLAAHSRRCYRLYWNWQYEDWYTAELDNSMDTAAAMNGGIPYLLGLYVRAEQVIPIVPDNPDDDTRYPGRG